jgi:hypothetical protein
MNLARGGGNLSRTWLKSYKRVVTRITRGGDCEYCKVNLRQGQEHGSAMLEKKKTSAFDNGDDYVYLK